MSLTPALAVEHPDVAALVPWFFGAAIAMVLCAIVVSLCLHILAARRTDSHSELDTNLRGVDFQGAGRRLLVLHRMVRVLALLIFIAWMVLYLLGGVRQSLTELTFVVIYACLVAPLYVVTRILGSAFRRFGTVVEARQGHE